MADDLTLTMRTPGRHRVNCAFEAVESHGLVGLRNAECLVVVVSADVTNCHLQLLLARYAALAQAERPSASASSSGGAGKPIRHRGTEFLCLGLN
jgi:hypothetical protein